MERKETMDLLKKLGEVSLIQPTLIKIDQRIPDRYQLQIKGAYNRQQMEIFVRKKNLAIIENKDKGYLLIFKP